MLRRIIHIDEDKCNGCGICAQTCHEGAIGIVGNKAKLLRDDYCDGLGDCLPACPANAISFIERETLAYDEAAVLANKKAKSTAPAHACPSSAARSFHHPSLFCHTRTADSQLAQWPCQIKLAPLNAAYFDNAHLLIAADCTAFAYANIHQEFMAGKITLIGCTKLDNVDYSEKLAQIIAANTIKSVSVLRMEVPCCGALERAVSTAIEKSGKNIPVSTTIISTDGRILR